MAEFGMAEAAAAGELPDEISLADSFVLGLRETLQAPVLRAAAWDVILAESEEAGLTRGQALEVARRVSEADRIFEMERQKALQGELEKIQAQRQAGPI